MHPDKQTDQASPAKQGNEENNLSQAKKDSYSLQGNLGPQLKQEDEPSTRQLKLALCPLPCKSIYKLNPRILQHTPITQNMRARLRSFLMAESSKQCILRQTCVLACNLMDLYFLNKGYVDVKQFQNLVIGCLIIATKIKEGKFPTISYNIFNKEQLLLLQRKIAKKLNFDLNPTTYYNYAERIIYLWDYFTQKEKIYNLKYSDPTPGVNLKLRRFFQQLDCSFMVLKSLSFDCEELVLNIFYMNARMMNLYEIANVSELPKAQFLTLFYPRDHFQLFYEKFLMFYGFQKPSPNPIIGNFFRHALVVAPKQKQWTIRGNAEVLFQVRSWDKIQTFPKDNYALAKIIIQKISKDTE